MFARHSRSRSGLRSWSRATAGRFVPPAVRLLGQWSWISQAVRKERKQPGQTYAVLHPLRNHRSGEARRLLLQGKSSRQRQHTNPTATGMSAEDKALFDAASPEKLREYLRRRGVFVPDSTPKKELQRLFGWGFTFQEWNELTQLTKKA